MKLGLALLGLVWMRQSMGMGLEEFLDRVRAKNGAYESSRLGIDAAEARRLQGDLTLSPYLTAKALWLDDKRPQAVRAFQGTRTQTRDVSFGIAKQFASGTGLSLGYGFNKSTVEGASLPVLEPWTSGLTLGLSQSLWKNFLGRGTGFRRERESASVSLERSAQEAEARQLLVSAEAAYWDVVYAREELRVRRQTLNRAERLVVWARRRLNSGVGDESDLLQARALESLKQTQLIGAEDEFQAAVLKAADFAGGDWNLFSEGMFEDYTKVRKPEFVASAGKPVRIDALVKEREAKVRKAAALEASDNLKPDLVLEGSVATASRKASYEEATGNSFDTSKPLATVQLRFNLDLDRSSLGKIRAGVDAEARAAELRAEQALRESTTSWEELIRRHKALGDRIAAADNAVALNRDKVRRENERLDLGRTTTFQVITFEQDHAEAQILLLKLNVEQRKLESKARLFVDERREGTL